MYHYNFTNDLRISNLDEILTESAKAFLTDSVPSATEDKSRNNNYNTVGSYFNLKAKGTCARLAANGNTRKVVLNFIKKFQFPNTRTQTDFENDKNDGILLAPMRDIVKLLYILSFINQEQAYLSKEEIKNFIFYNDDVAKRRNYNLINTANQIIQFRKDKKFPSNIDTVESEHIWNQPERQLREMLKTLNYTNCFTEDDNKIYFNAKKLTRDNEADLFEIINCNTYWQGNTNEEYQKYMDDIELSDEEKNMNTEIRKTIPSSIPRNRIIFGAPGTGKSHRLNIQCEEFFSSTTKHYERVTFHPNYSYSQFVGTYKPTMKSVQTDDGEKEEITYSFVAGPFLRVYVNAVNNKDEDFLLLIEEINRANVASVFGDVFQLLDRKADGTSEYPVAASDDIRKYLKSNGIDQTELSIPANMYIWATMNSADQGVFPMDTAFKRRWNFEYIGVNDEETVSQIKDIKLPIKDSDGKWSTIKWDSLRQSINKRLLSVCKVNEDKLLGAFFISKTDLEKANKCAEKEDDESIKEKAEFINLFKSKVLMYLYEDAAKMHVGKFFVGVNSDEMTYSKVCDEFEKKGIAVFGFSGDFQ